MYYFSNIFDHSQPNFAIFRSHMGRFTLIKFVYEMEKIMFFISHYEETSPFGYFEKYYTLLYETVK